MARSNITGKFRRLYLAKENGLNLINSKNIWMFELNVLGICKEINENRVQQYGFYKYIRERIIKRWYLRLSLGNG